MSRETNVDFGKVDILKLLNVLILVFFSPFMHMSGLIFYSLLPLFSSNIMSVTVFCFYGKYPFIDTRFVPMEE